MPAILTVSFVIPAGEFCFKFVDAFLPQGNDVMGETARVTLSRQANLLPPSTVSHALLKNSEEGKSHSPRNQDPQDRRQNGGDHTGPMHQDMKE